jgi:hypothetical protein
MNRLKDRSRGPRPGRWAESGFSSSRFVFALTAANLVHGEAEIGDHLLEGNTFAAPFEIVARGRDRSAILVRQFLFIIIDDNFEQTTHDSQLFSRQPFEKRLRLLAFLGEIARLK